MLDLLNNKKLPDDKYIDSFSVVVSADKITQISRISKNCLCVYLTAPTESKYSENGASNVDDLPFSQY